MSREVEGRELVHAAERAARIHALARGLECAAAGILGGAVVFAAGIASGAVVAADLVLVSIVLALITAGLAWRERPPHAADVARRADRAAGLAGALPAVLDQARHARAGTPSASGLAALLAEQVRAAVRPADLFRAALPRSPLALAAPLLGAALVVVALEHQPVEVGSASGTAASLRGAAEHSRASGARATADALEIAARRVESIERSAERGGALSDPLERSRTVLDLERLAQSLAVDDPARAILDRAARAITRETPRAVPEAPSRGQGPVDGGRDPGPGAEGSSASAGTGAASGGAGLANGSGDGRMFGPPAGGESDPQPGGPASGTVGPGGPGRGVLSARWWPSRYDAVVERYLAP
ncbi:MAG: hypothetical protein NTY35_09655 [Planctomycetota bacterium]|nr:hypothetical protein [Planctomycetota bacterium]